MGAVWPCVNEEVQLLKVAAEAKKKKGEKIVIKFIKNLKSQMLILISNFVSFLEWFIKYDIIKM